MWTIIAKGYVEDPRGRLVIRGVLARREILPSYGLNAYLVWGQYETREGAENARQEFHPDREPQVVEEDTVEAVLRLLTK